MNDPPLGFAPGPSYRRPRKPKTDAADRVAAWLKRHTNGLRTDFTEPPSMASEIRAALRACDLKLVKR